MPPIDRVGQFVQVNALRLQTAQKRGSLAVREGLTDQNFVAIVLDIVRDVPQVLLKFAGHVPRIHRRIIGNPSAV